MGARRTNLIRTLVALVACGALVIAAGAAGAGATTAIGPQAWSATADGRGVDISVGLPAGAVSGDVGPGSVGDQIGGSHVDGEWVLAGVHGHATAQTFGDSTSQMAGMPRASVGLDDPDQSTEFQRKDAGPLHVSAGEVAASAARGDAAMRGISASGSSRAAGVRVVLADLGLDDAQRQQVEQGIDTLLAVLYGGASTSDPVPPEVRDQIGAGIIPALQSQLDTARKTLADNGVDAAKLTGLDFKLPRITRDQILERPLVSAEAVRSGTTIRQGTAHMPGFDGNLEGYRVIESTAQVAGLDILGGLVHLDKLTVTVGVAVNGKPKQAVLRTPERTIAGLRIGDARIDVGDPSTLQGLRVNGRNLHDTLTQADALLAEQTQGARDAVKSATGTEVPMPNLTETVEGLYAQLITQVLGLGVSFPAVLQDVQDGIIDKGTVKLPTGETREDKEAFQVANQSVTGMLIDVRPLGGTGGLPTISMGIGSLQARAGVNVPLSVLGKRITRCANGPCNPRTGVPTDLFTMGGLLLLGSAILLKRFALR